jgi:hypothetical protein
VLRAPSSVPASLQGLCSTVWWLPRYNVTLLLQPHIVYSHGRPEHEQREEGVVKTTSSQHHRLLVTLNCTGAVPMGPKGSWGTGRCVTSQ